MKIYRNLRKKRRNYLMLKAAYIMYATYAFQSTPDCIKYKFTSTKETWVNLIFVSKGTQISPSY